jgi:hypothetical protein
MSEVFARQLRDNPLLAELLDEYVKTHYDMWAVTEAHETAKREMLYASVNTLEGFKLFLTNKIDEALNATD